MSSDEAIYRSREYVGRIKRLRGGGDVFVDSAGVDNAGVTTWGLLPLGGQIWEVTGEGNDLFEGDSTDRAMRDGVAVTRMARSRPAVVVRWFEEHPEEILPQEAVIELTGHDDTWVRTAARTIALRQVPDDA